MEDLAEQHEKKQNLYSEIPTEIVYIKQEKDVENESNNNDSNNIWLAHDKDTNIEKVKTFSKLLIPTEERNKNEIPILNVVKVEHDNEKSLQSNLNEPSSSKEDSKYPILKIEVKTEPLDATDYENEAGNCWHNTIHDSNATTSILKQKLDYSVPRFNSTFQLKPNETNALDKHETEDFDNKKVYLQTTLIQVEIEPIKIEQSEACEQDGGVSDDSSPEPSFELRSTRVENYKKYFCDSCNRQFAKRCCLVTHIFNIHFDGPSGSREKLCNCERDRPYECEICHKRFFTRDNMNKHTNLHNPKKYYFCHVCDKKFKRKSYFKRHYVHHTNIRPFKCSTCHKSFAEKGTLKRHEVIHSGERAYNCEVCHKQFLEKGHLKEHLKIHSGEKSFECDICHKKFRQNGHLKEHKLIHTKEKIMKCGECKQEFNNKNDLNLHQQTHEGQKPFCCKICHKQFTQNSHYINHMRIHSGDKPYKCKFCQKKFSQKSVLTRHLSIHSDERPFTCDICQNRFRRKYNLASHKKKVHKELPIEIELP